jgi:hypothetical protein
LERVIDLSDVDGELRTRTLAVAFAEMLLRLPAPAETQPATDEKTSAPGAPNDPGSAVRAEGLEDAGTARAPGEPGDATTWYLASGIGVRSYWDPQTTLIGPWLSFELGPFQPEALFLTTSESVATGTVSLYDLAASLGWAPLKFGKAVQLALGVRTEVGMTWAAGSPGTDSEARGVTRLRARAALLAEPRIDVALSPALSAQARLSAGVAHGATATADRRPAATSSGAFLGTAVGLRLGF